MNRNSSSLYSSQHNDNFQILQNIEDTPIKTMRKVKQLYKTKQEQQKFLQQLNQNHSLNNNYHKSQGYSISKSKSFANQSKIIYPQTNQLNKNYIVECIIRALQFRKLSIDDIAEIFSIQSQMVEQIDKFRRLKELQSSSRVKNIKTKMNKQKLKTQISNQIKYSNLKQTNTITNLSRQNFILQNRINYLYSHKNDSRFQNLIKPYTKFQPNLCVNKKLGLDQLNKNVQKNEDENIFEYQKILRKKPPHRLDEKTKAIVEILKDNPNLLQKQIVKTLQQKYGIKGITQTSICRYLKRIYQMRQYVIVLKQAIKDGFLAMDIDN